MLYPVVMKIMLKKLSAFVFLLLYSSISLADQLTAAQIDLPSSFNPVGSGARALGMGGAFISIADDATAASWNPAGLIQLRNPELAIVGGYTGRTEDMQFSALPQANNKGTIQRGQLNYFSASLPCGAERCGRNMIFSVNYQRLYDFDQKINQHYQFRIEDAVLKQDIDRQFAYSQNGEVYALGLAYAVQVNEVLSLGFSLNFWGDYLGNNGWNKSYTTVDISQADFGGTILNQTLKEWRKEQNDFRGFNLNLGAFWQVFSQDEQKLTIGAVIKTPFSADVKRVVYRTIEQSLNGSVPVQSSSVEVADETYDMPLSYGVGVSWQFSDAWTLAADIYRTHWQDFIRSQADGKRTIGFGNTLEADSQVEATTQLRIGVEHRIISQEFGANYIIPLRAGIFYDPIPTNGRPDNVYGFSLGGGIAYQTFVFDIAYQYRFGNNLGRRNDAYPQSGFAYDLSEHQLYGSVFYRF